MATARDAEAIRARPEWVRDAVVYGVVPRNFDPPDFAGVTARLDDLRDLGVTALWPDLGSGERVAIAGDQLMVSIPGWGFRVLAPHGVRSDDPAGGLTLAGKRTGDRSPLSATDSEGDVT